VSVVVNQHGDVRAVVPKRVICKKGVTRIAVTEHVDAIDRVCRQVQDKLRANGPFNVQCILRDGVPYIFEINPRFSTTCALTIKAGVDEVGGLIDELLGLEHEWTDFRDGVTLVRRTENVFMDWEEYEARDTQIERGEQSV
jgi:carbamoyl-phosphate synthase large subunit